MGLDGGTYITRNDVLRGQCWDLNKADNSRSTRGGAVKGTHKRAKLDPKVARQTKWRTCSLSEQPLKAPIVADFLGNLYNKVAVLEFLLGRSGNFPDKAAEHRFFNQMNASGNAFQHLQSLRDIFEVKLDAPASDTMQLSYYNCPVTDLPCESHPFSALSSCGHVFSDRAIQQMNGEACGSCSKPIEEDAVIPINGTAEQIEVLAEKLKSRQAKRRRSKLKKRGDDEKRQLLTTELDSHVPPKRLRESCD